MLLKRRKPPTMLESFRVWIWPRRSWLRSGQYVTKRILRLTATPHAVAAGVAAGAFTSFTPFMGLHFIIAFIIAWLLRGNLLASALGTFVGNPLSFPLIWAATYQTGHYILGSTASGSEPVGLVEAMGNILDSIKNLNGAEAVAALEQIWLPVLYPMTVGGLIWGVIVALPIYLATRRAAALFRESRRNKLMRKAAEIQARAKQLASQDPIANGAARS